MVVADQETRDLISALSSRVIRGEDELELLDRYYDGKQRLQVLGWIAPEALLQKFATVVNVPRVAVDEPVRRQKLRAFQRRGSSLADPALREAWEANNLDSQAPLCHKDTRIFGRGIVTVSTNPDDAKHPSIQVENPRQFSYVVDNRRRRMKAALRYWHDDDEMVHRATLYLPDRTTWLVNSEYGWQVEDVDDHRLGQVPVVLFLNRPRTGVWRGTSEMSDVMGMTDAIARLVTNLQIGAESHSLPGNWATGVNPEDFRDRDGKPIPTWETYASVIKATANKDAKFGQFSASDLKNFHESVNHMLSWCAGVLGLPLRYMGLQSVNPASEGAIVADEARLISNVEGMNAADGDSWAWVGALYERFRTGEWLPANELRALWENPATPTLAERADAMLKLRSQGLISREGVWDELGWDEARKDRERAYLEREQSDDVVMGLLRGVNDGVDGAVAGGAGVVPDEGQVGVGGGTGGTPVPFEP